MTVLDYYGCCFVLCGVILSSEPFPSSIIWALGCCLVGTPACAAWAVFRMVTAEPHPLLKRTGLELYSTVNAGGRMQRDSVFKSVSWPLGWAPPWPFPSLRVRRDDLADELTRVPVAPPLWGLKLANHVKSDHHDRHWLHPHMHWLRAHRNHDVCTQA